MFAEQILNDLGSQLKTLNYNSKTEHYYNFIKLSMEKIKKSHKFHMGDYDSLYNLGLNLVKDPDFRLFNINNIKLPYKYSYFDYTLTTTTEGEIKVAMCIWESEKDPDLLGYLSFQYAKFDLKKWMLRPIFYVIATEDKFRKAYEKRDPILLVQSPFGFYWQILGAWDKEMILLSEL